MDTETIARSLVQRLVDAGHQALYAGGWVRDRLLGLPSDDIDIATSATPHQVMELFEKTVPVGIEFGSVVVVEEGHSFEVTTFRTEGGYFDARHPSQIEFSTAEEDARRRGLTINGMFWDPLKEEVLDFVGGQKDLKAGIVRTVGDPDERFTEDRLRMIRTLRFATRFGFTVDPPTGAAIKKHAHELFPPVAMERVWQELNKMNGHPKFGDFLVEMQHYELLPEIFPQLREQNIEERVACFGNLPEKAPTIAFLMELFPDANLEERVALCRHLKASNNDIKWATHLWEGAQLLANPAAEPVHWVHFYSLPNGQAYLEVLAASRPDREAFLKHHTAEQRRLAPHIERKRAGLPLVTSEHLKEAGISPGRRMGDLLREAERLAINENLSSAEDVLQKLGIET